MSLLFGVSVTNNDISDNKNDSNSTNIMFKNHDDNDDDDGGDDMNGKITLAPQTSIPDPKTVDSMMVKELNEMSTKERERVYDDIHGTSHIINEEPELVNKCLYEMRIELNKIRKKDAYEIAKSQSQRNFDDYVGGRAMNLMFLRSTNFDPKQAAVQVVTHFEFKRLYFGDGLLGRPILYTDLDADDLVCLKSGWIQTIQFRDNSGRSVIFFMSQFMPDMKPFSIMRAAWYGAMILIENGDYQNRGFVAVATADETLNLNKERIETLWYLSRCRDYLPFRMVAIHFCIERTSRTLQLVSFINTSWGKNDRARSRIHHGTQTEWKYSLMAYGIPVDHVPITNSGKIKTKYYRENLTEIINLESKRQEWRRQAQQLLLLSNNTRIPPEWSVSDLIEKDNQSRVIQPFQSDVLIGPGSVVQKHAGNHLFNHIVDDFREEFQKDKKKKRKQQVVVSVLEALRQENIRFLKASTGEAYYTVMKTDKDKEEIKEIIMKRLRMKIISSSSAGSSKSTSSSEDAIKNDRNQKEDESQDHVPSFLNQTGDSDLVDCCNSCMGGNIPNKNKRPRIA